MMVLETSLHSPRQACVGLGLIATDNPHIFSCSVKENGDIKTNETWRQAGRVPSPDIGPKIILPGLTVTSHGATERGVTRRENPNMYRRPTPSLTAQQPWQVGTGGEITTLKSQPTSRVPTDAGDKDSNRAAGGA